MHKYGCFCSLRVKSISWVLDVISTYYFIIAQHHNYWQRFLHFLLCCHDNKKTGGYTLDPLVVLSAQYCILQQTCKHYEVNYHWKGPGMKYILFIQQLNITTLTKRMVWFWKTIYILECLLLQRQLRKLTSSLRFTFFLVWTT